MLCNTLSIFQCVAETQVEHHTGTCQSKGERHPHAGQAKVEHKTEDITRGQRYYKIGNEGKEHHWLDIGNTAQGIGVVALHSVTHLVKDERDSKLCYKQYHIVVVGEDCTNVVAHREYDD